MHARAARPATPAPQWHAPGRDGKMGTGRGSMSAAGVAGLVSPSMRLGLRRRLRAWPGESRRRGVNRGGKGKIVRWGGKRSGALRGRGALGRDVPPQRRPAN